MLGFGEICSVGEGTVSHVVISVQKLFWLFFNTTFFNCINVFKNLL